MAKKLHLTLTCGDYEIMRPLKDGTVEPDGIELTVLTEGASRDRHPIEPGIFRGGVQGF